MTDMNSKIKRKLRVRRALKKNKDQRPRLSVFRSSKNIYAQIINDIEGKTLASASTLEKDQKKVSGSDKFGGRQRAGPDGGRSEDDASVTVTAKWSRLEPVIRLSSGTAA